MKLFSLSTVLLFTLLAASCANRSNNKHLDDDAAGLVPHPTTDQGKHGYWKNPDVIYVAEDIPSGAKPLSVRDVPQLERAFIDTAPKSRNDGLAASALSAENGDKAMLVTLAREIADGQHGKMNSLLIAHKGELVFESYYALGRVNLALPQASATKTYTSLTLGRAIQLGYLTMDDLDRPLISFLKEVDPTTLVEGADRLTLHQALTMRSGIRLGDPQKDALDENPDQVKGQRLVQTILEQSAPITAQSQSAFSYGNYSSPMVMQVIDAVVPGTAEDFIRQELFGKLGITTYGWMPGLGGLPAGGWRSSVAARDMLKVGMLAMNKGKWNGEQLISEAFISKATSRILYNGDDDIFGGGKNVSGQGYGYFWWSGDLTYGDRTYFSVSAQGGGGQFIILIEELDLIVVATGYERHPTTLQLTAERILPAFVE